MTGTVLKVHNKTDLHHVATKKVRTADGEMKTMRFVDLDSPTLTNDLLYVFRQERRKGPSRQQARYGLARWHPPTKVTRRGY